MRVVAGRMELAILFVGIVGTTHAADWSPCHPLLPEVRSEEAFPVPAALASCPRGDSEAVMVQGVHMTRTAIQDCLGRFVDEDLVCGRDGTTVRAATEWSVHSAHEFRIGDDVVFYEVNVAPFSSGENGLGAVLGVLFEFFYVCPERGGPPTLRQDARGTADGPEPAPRLPSWATAELSFGAAGSDRR